MRRSVKVGDTCPVRLRAGENAYTVTGRIVAIPTHRRFAVVEYSIDCGMWLGVKRTEKARTTFWLERVVIA